MFNKIFKRPYTVKKHTNFPLLDERLAYLRYWDRRTNSKNTLQSAAQYLLRIVEYLNLENNYVVTINEIENAANRWGRYQYNHPQKRAAFSKNGKERFIWYARDWLKKMNRLEPPPEEKIPLFNKIFEHRIALQHHTTAPLLEERLMYLQYWADNGAPEGSLRGIAQYLMVVIKYLDFKQVRSVSLDEIKKAAERWARDETNYCRENDYSNFAKNRFVRHALGWFKMINCLKQTIKKPIPFKGYLSQYIIYMRQEQGLCETTIKSKICILKDFLEKTNKHIKDFKKLTPRIVDKVLIKKHDIDGCSRRTIQTYASGVRSFLKYTEHQNWCQKGLASSINAPRVYTYEALPSSPRWDDVKKILANCRKDQPTDIRDRAILMLLSIYGMRCSEVTHLRLEDIDWKSEKLYLKRAKSSKPQIFPLSKIVGDAILAYLQNVRPNHSSLREVFLCRRSPYRPLTSPAIYRIVSSKLKPLNLNIKHHGPHALRHACATHLINEGLSLKEISDHLGHQGLETTRIYTKVDLKSLRKVADFKMGDLL